MGNNEHNKPVFSRREIEAQRREIRDLAQEVRSRDSGLADYMDSISHGPPEVLLGAMQDQVPRARRLIRKMADPDRHSHSGGTPDYVVHKSGFWVAAGVGLASIAALGAFGLSGNARASESRPASQPVETAPGRIVPEHTIVNLSGISSNLRTPPVRSARSIVR